MAAVLLALAACSRPQMPPFERSPANPDIAAALVRTLAGEAACKAFELVSAQVWQYPLENHTNVANYALDVDADVTAVRRAPSVHDVVTACFGPWSATPPEWAVGERRTVRTRAWLAYDGHAWSLRTEAGGAASLPAAAPHAFRLGLNGKPGR